VKNLLHLNNNKEKNSRILHHTGLLLTAVEGRTVGRTQQGWSETSDAGCDLLGDETYEEMKRLALDRPR